MVKILDTSPSLLSSGCLESPSEAENDMKLVGFFVGFRSHTTYVHVQACMCIHTYIRRYMYVYAYQC